MVQFRTIKGILLALFLDSIFQTPKFFNLLRYLAAAPRGVSVRGGRACGRVIWAADVRARKLEENGGKKKLIGRADVAL